MSVDPATPQFQTMLPGCIDYAEQRINEIVYELYGLTKDEITLIENA